MKKVQIEAQHTKQKSAKKRHTFTFFQTQFEWIKLVDSLRKCPP